VNQQSTFYEYINSSNLCEEVQLPTKPLNQANEQLFLTTNNEPHITGSKLDPGEIALCNLSSVNAWEVWNMNHDDLKYMTYNLLRASDNLIDYAYYPVKEAEISNKMRRSIGVGLNNYAYVFAKLGIDVVKDLEQARQVTFQLMETLAYHLYSAAIHLAKERGPAPWFHKTKYAQGILPHDLSLYPHKNDYTFYYNWDRIREQLKTIGMRFSTILALMPTSSSSVKANTT